MAEDIEQLEVKEIPKECPVCEPCPVCPSKLKLWKICLRGLLLLVAGLAFAFVILACSGLRIIRKESLLDIWLASRKGITPTPEVIEPTPTPDLTANWKTYTNIEFKYTLKYPSDWYVITDGLERIIIKNKLTTPVPGSSGFYSQDENNIQIGISVKRNKEGWSLEDYFNKQSENRVLDDWKKISVNNVSAYRVVYKEEIGAGNPEIYFVTKDYLVSSSISYDTSREAAIDFFDQILSTFKFLDQDQNRPVTISFPDLTGSVQRPLVITGTVEAGWMFEGVFPVKLLDANRKEIARSTAREVTPGSWQSGQPVEFSATLTFTTQSTSGFLVFENDNPSGLPENAKSFEIPLKFK